MDISNRRSHNLQEKRTSGKETKDGAGKEEDKERDRIDNDEGRE